MRTEAEIRDRLKLLRRIIADATEPPKSYIQAVLELEWVLDGDHKTPHPKYGDDQND